MTGPKSFAFNVNSTKKSVQLAFWVMIDRRYFVMSLGKYILEIDYVFIEYAILQTFCQNRFCKKAESVLTKGL